MPVKSILVDGNTHDQFMALKKDFETKEDLLLRMIRALQTLENIDEIDRKFRKC